MTDENAPAMMGKRGTGAGGGLGASGGLGARMGQKSFGDVKMPARAALGNITNRGRPEGGGTQMSARKPGLALTNNVESLGSPEAFSLCFQPSKKSWSEGKPINDAMNSKR